MEIEEPAQAWARASLVIRSTETDADAISSRLGLRPSRTSRAGDPVSSRRPNGPVRTHHVWCLESSQQDTGTLSSSLEALLAELGSTIEAIRALPADCELEVWLAVTAADAGRVHGLDPSLVRQVGELGAGLVVDAYTGE